MLTPVIGKCAVFPVSRVAWCSCAIGLPNLAFRGRVVDRDGVARRDVPLDDLCLVEALAQVGEEEGAHRAGA